MDTKKFARVAELLSRARVPAACIGVIDATGERASWAYGLASIEPAVPATPDTVFHLFSGTKLYTAAATMLLVERGLIALDDPVQEHVEDLHLRHPVTVRQLMSHDSGLGDTLAGFLAVHFLDGRPSTTAEALARYRLDKAKQPGRGAAYRNVNYAILGELISRIAGRPYETFVREALLSPLGSGAEYSYADSTTARAATGYLPRLSPMRLALRLFAPEVSKRLYAKPTGRFMALEPYSLDTAAIGGLLGSVPDFLPFLEEMLDPSDGVLRAESKRQMLTLHAHGAAGIVSRVGVGLGWKLGQVDGVEFLNHEGGGAGFCSETRLYPSEGIGVVILMNLSQSMKLSRVAHRICEEIREQG